MHGHAERWRQNASPDASAQDEEGEDSAYLGLFPVPSLLRLAPSLAHPARLAEIPILPLPFEGN
jgi:hypothetical protein